MLSRIIVVLFGGIFVLLSGELVARQADAKKQPSDQLAKAGFDIYHVQRSDGATINCYLTNSPRKLPLIVQIDGSGAGSAFTKSGNGRINSGLTGFLASLVENEAHVLVIEKPGVSLFDQREKGRVRNASKTFFTNYTLEYVTQSHVEAIQAVLQLPHVSNEKVLIFGISDGGQFATEVSANLPEATHVAALCCGGPTQIFDFVTFAARPQPNDQPGDAQRRVEQVYKDWQAIRDDPLSIEKFWNGHPYRRWASLCSSSSTDALLKTDAQIFVAHGTLDDSVPIESFDMLVSTLRSKGKNIVAERLEGLDHHFRSKEEIENRGNASFDQLLGRILEWWKSSEAESP